jgi:hypothetical protein
LDEAIALRGQYPNLRIRVVALNRAELEMFGAKRQSDANTFGVNVITPYHGVTNWVWRGGKQKEYTGKLNDLVRADNPRIFETLGEEKAIAWLDTWENMGAKSVTAQEYQKKFSGFMCCTSGKCAGDNTKCGFATKVAEMGGVALMILGGSNSIFLGEADDNEVMWGGSI